MSRLDRQNVIKEVLSVVAKSYASANAFACAVHKESFPNRDPMELAFEDLCSRFDMFLKRKRNDTGENHRGLIVLDESTYETNLQQLARHFRTVGTQWNVIRNIVDVPLFVDSKASRCVQVADNFAYSVFRRYNAGDTNYLDIILSRFNFDGQVLHGLSHKGAGKSTCMCPACMGRYSQSPGSISMSTTTTTTTTTPTPDIGADSASGPEISELGSSFGTGLDLDGEK